MTQDPKDARPVQLHVIHDLGGGSEKWLRDFGRADASRANLVLRSFTYDRAAGCGIALYADAEAEQPVKAWTFTSKIVATVVAHPEYKRALDEILREHRVDVMVVSSLIGHSLEALDTGLATLVVNHDYFPYCPAINIHFEELCRECDGARIGKCHAGNPRFNPFVDFLPADRIAVRERFVELSARPGVTMVVPSHSVRENLTRLEPRFAKARFVTIPHGYGEPLVRKPAPEPAAKDRLRVMVFGQLSEAKGLELLEAVLPELTRFSEVFLVGAKEVGELFRGKPHVHVVSNYEFSELAGHVANINPHLGILASIVAETFSYALSELWMLGIPVAATRVGAFAERLRDRETGYLFEPTPRAMLKTIEGIDLDRETLARVRRNVLDWKPVSAEEMVEQYHRAAPAAGSRAVQPAEVAVRTPDPGASTTEALAVQAVTVAGMWKQVRSAHLQMALINEARSRTEEASRAAADHFARVRTHLDAHIEGLTHAVAERDAGLVRRAADLAEKERVIAELQHELRHRMEVINVRTAQLDEIHRSTSWRLSSPVRAVGWMLRKARTGFRALTWMARDPSAIPGRLRKLRDSWSRGGLNETKKALVGMRQEDLRRHDLWTDYRERFERDVLPRVAEAVAAMPVRPLVSVIVPTYDTREKSLVEMIESVRAQVYTDWELCIADDASTQPHVRRILEKYAQEDGRINVRFNAENRGVSYTSNRALEIATGDWIVLLDHDDTLEEHALFRVAQAGYFDNADFIYSDEVLTTPDGATVRRYAYRPAFSLEYLRSHPYIVHLVAFRSSLLREIGGFDEKLRISQDYDLILRAAERAKTIVHIPDILYRWRIHGGSSGTDRKQQVMDTSRGILQEHLGRSQVAGSVNEGESFNLFEARYSVKPGTRVAIIIPTKNHGDLLEQCIDSLRATIKEVPYDIVVVDHESDDPATREYLLTLADSVRIVRYAGVFNFSAINNFAVEKLPEGYTHYLFCNNDIEAIEPGWLERMAELGAQPDVGIVGAMLFYPDRKHLQHAGVCVGMYGAAEHYGKWVRFPDDPIEPELMRSTREVSAVTAALLLARADAFREVRGFDESIAVGFGDVDLCLRVGDRGFRVLLSPHARLVHHESYTRGTSTVDPHPKDSALFRLKWRAFLQAGDPFYNPGYSNEHTHWPVKQPLNVAFDIRRRIVRRDPETGRIHRSFSAPYGT
jgi:GT2 family glycosyltransferase/glycosyltransferase involved in cell wall biosynthesis